MFIRKNQIPIQLYNSSNILKNTLLLAHNIIIFHPHRYTIIFPFFNITKKKSKSGRSEYNRYTKYYLIFQFHYVCVHMCVFLNFKSNLFSAWMCLLLCIVCTCLFKSEFAKNRFGDVLLDKGWNLVEGDCFIAFVFVLESFKVTFLMRNGSTYQMAIIWVENDSNLVHYVMSACFYETFFFRRTTNDINVVM